MGRDRTWHWPCAREGCATIRRSAVPRTPQRRRSAPAGLLHAPRWEYPAHATRMSRVDFGVTRMPGGERPRRGWRPNECAGPAVTTLFCGEGRCGWAVRGGRPHPQVGENLLDHGQRFIRRARNPSRRFCSSVRRTYTRVMVRLRPLLQRTAWQNGHGPRGAEVLPWSVRASAVAGPASGQAQAGPDGASAHRIHDRILRVPSPRYPHQPHSCGPPSRLVSPFRASRAATSS